MDAIHARSVAGFASALEDAERRVREAERARDAAIRERDALAGERDALAGERDALAGERDVTAQALAERTKERDDSDAARRQLALEKKALENETELLLQRVAELTKKLADATDTDRQLALSLEIKRLQRRLDDRNEALFGTSSERRGHEGEDDEPSGDEEQKKKGKKKAKRRGPRPQPKLKRTPQLHLIDDEELEGGCDMCSGDLGLMEGQTEDSDKITARRPVYEIIVVKKQKYRCEDCKHIVTAPGPKPFMPGGRYTEDFAVQVAIDKYVDHLPLNRQAQRMARRGLEVTRQTLCDQLERLYILLVPTLMVLHERILQAALVYADETTWRVMGKGRSKKWWVWVLSDGQAVYFQVVPSRGNAAGRQLLRDYAGWVMADDYSVYNSLEQERTKQGGCVQVMDEEGKVIALPTPDFILLTCWMHARRYFVKAARYHDEAERALDIIAKLYLVDREAKEQAERKVQLEVEAGDPEAQSRYDEYLMAARRSLRAERSRPLIDELDAWRKSQKPMPGSALDEALAHLDKIWAKLILVLDDPRIPLDNGLAERLVRGPVLGRKNFQGSRSETGTRVAALFYSLLSTCRLMAIDPHAYLIEATRRAIANRKSVFLPHDYRDMLREEEEVKKAAKGGDGAEGEGEGEGDS